MRRARTQVPSDVARPAPRVNPIEGEYDLGERLLRDMVKRADERRYDREYWRLVDQLGDEDLVGTHPSGVPIDREVHESRVL